MQTSGSTEFGSELAQLIEENMTLKHWKFHLSYTELGDLQGIDFRKLIYDSEWCRVQFEYSRRVRPDDHELNIYYGRLHAPNNDYYMMWNGEKCHCWHDVRMPLFFLDGLSPLDVLQKKKDSQQPVIVERFWQSDLGTKEKPPVVNILKQSVIWDHYKTRLFELFDLSRPDLWGRYVAFLKKYYELEEADFRLKGITPIPIDPPRYKVC